MSRTISCFGPARPAGATRNHRFRDGVDPHGFRLVALTPSHSKFILNLIEGRHSFIGERARSRIAPSRPAVPAFSPVANGSNSMRRNAVNPASALSEDPRSGVLRNALMVLAAALMLVAGLWWATPVRAQEIQIIHPGSMAVSGFPGTYIPKLEDGLPPGVDPVDEAFIDPNRASLRIFDASALGGPLSGQLADTPPPFEVLAGQIGQIFGLTYDDGVRHGQPSGVPNLYAAATSLHGIQIVTPDADGDGRPERRRPGAPGARFMQGQFAEENGGSPGAIWKIDGLTGALSLFTTIRTNSGPGIGDIAFDKAHRQFFASDLDSGLIHRIGADGKLIDIFDHGLNGRPAHGLAPVADDGALMDIHSAAFDSEDAKTWGYTPDARRVWAVQVHGGRLYYSVGEKAEIWSVGINEDGSFAGDPRWELTVKADQDLAVTDIVFDNRGFMYLAQRGRIDNRYDYSRFADSGAGEVLRYRLENPDNPATESVWVATPQEYAVGFPEGYRQTDGGIDLQYGYDSKGKIDFKACADTIAKTGDRLRESATLADRLRVGGPLAVHGVQLTPTALVRPRNEPPFGSAFVDFDGFYEDPAAEGHVGDVEIWHPCEGQAGYTEPDRGRDGYLLPYPPRHELPPITVKKTGDDECEVGGSCAFIITITNDGDKSFSGPMRIGDAMEVDGIGRLKDVAINSVEPPFGCASTPRTLPFSCAANLSLAAGQSEVHRVVVTLPDARHSGIGDGELRGRNCVAVLKPGTPVTDRQLALKTHDGGSEGQQHRAYSCHPFRITHHKPQCSVGFVMNDAGRCQCPQGTRFRNGRCAGGRKPNNPPPPVRQCTLLPGQIRTDDGRCVCPKGMELGRRGCFTPPPVQQCRLLPGQIRTRDGECVCRRGTELVRGACRRHRVECPEGTRMRRGRCVDIPRRPVCERDEVLRYGRCVTIDRRCPRGMEGKPPYCREIEERQPSFVPGILLSPGILNGILPGGGRHGGRPSRGQRLQ